MKHALLPLLSILPAIAVGMLLAQNPPKDAPYKNPKLPVEQRVEDLLRRMTPREKAQMLSGAGWMETQPNARLGIPSIKMADGPMGVRNWAGPSAVTSAAATAPVFSTAFPAGIGMACAPLHADTGSGNKPNVFCRIARRTNDILLGFADLVEDIKCLATIGTLILIDRHRESLPFPSIV